VLLVAGAPGILDLMAAGWFLKSSGVTLHGFSAGSGVYRPGRRQGGRLFFFIVGGVCFFFFSR